MVNIWLETYVEDYEDNFVSTNQQIEFRADTVIWAAGVAGKYPEGIDANLTGRGNRIIVDEYLKMITYPSVYVPGDAGLIQSDTYSDGLPMLAAVAMQQGIYLGKYFNRLAKNKEVVPFTYNDKGTMATIGRNQACSRIIQIEISRLHRLDRLDVRPSYAPWLDLETG